MANSPQARKRARQSARRRVHNMSQRSALRSSIKKLLKHISENNLDDAKLAYRDASARIDRAASNGLHHSNRAARLKKRLNNRIRALST